VPAAGPAPIEVARDLSAVFALIVAADPAISQTVDPDRDQSSHFRALDGFAPLIPCALRI
jgi:hypothetical protein